MLTAEQTLVICWLSTDGWWVLAASPLASSHWKHCIFTNPLRRYDHHRLFKYLFPALSLWPKHHFMIHQPLFQGEMFRQVTHWAQRKVVYSQEPNICPIWQILDFTELSSYLEALMMRQAVSVEILLLFFYCCSASYHPLSDCSWSFWLKIQSMLMYLWVQTMTESCSLTHIWFPLCENCKWGQAEKATAAGHLWLIEGEPMGQRLPSPPWWDQDKLSTVWGGGEGGRGGSQQ